MPLRVLQYMAPPRIRCSSAGLPADTIATGYKVDVPPYALMVLSKDRDEFFAQNKLPDNKTSTSLLSGMPVTFCLRLSYVA